MSAPESRHKAKTNEVSTRKTLRGLRDNASNHDRMACETESGHETDTHLRALLHDSHHDRMDVRPVTFPRCNSFPGSVQPAVARHGRGFAGPRCRREQTANKMAKGRRSRSSSEPHVRLVVCWFWNRDRLVSHHGVDRFFDLGQRACTLLGRAVESYPPSARPRRRPPFTHLLVGKVKQQTEPETDN